MNQPDTNPKSIFGMAKPGISSIPPVALLHCGRGMDDGVIKYGLTNWRENSVSAGVYYNAAFRHLASWWDGEQNASDSGVHHLGHVMACCAILLDAEASGCLVDDRPKVPGMFSEMVKALTRSMGEPVTVEDFDEPTDGDRRCLFSGLALDDEFQAQIQAEIADDDASAGLCVDEGCDHHGTPHVCLEITPEYRAEVAAIWDDASVLRNPVAERAPAQKGGLLDPGMDKTHEIIGVVQKFLDEEGADRHSRSKYVTDWLDRNGIRRLRHMGSIRDQAALYDHIDRYVEA